MTYPEYEVRPSVHGIPPAYPLYNPFFKMETACSLCYKINTHLYMLQSPATIYLLFIFGFTKTVISKDMLMTASTENVALLTTVLVYQPHPASSAYIAIT
jgi:hypothetical protein